MDPRYADRIYTDPERRSGKPCIRGTRIAVMDVFEYLASGMTVTEVLDDFPDLTPDDILACFAFAAIKTYRPLAPEDYPNSPVYPPVVHHEPVVR